MTSQTIPVDQLDAENYVNAQHIEQQFAVKCIHQAQTYWNIITQGKKGSELHLTKVDDELYDDLKITFPELCKNIAVVSEELLKTDEAKTLWREFHKRYEQKVPDFNFGTLVRKDGNEEYTEANSIFVTRLQFYAIEIARNKEGVNDQHFGKKDEDDVTKTGIKS